MALPTDIASGSAATIFVTSPMEVAISRTELDPAPWSPPVAQVVLVSNDLEAGVYRVQLQVHGETSARTIGSFELRFSE